MNDLTLADEILLLALDDSTGAVHSAANLTLDLGLAGALLAELSLNDRLTINGKHLAVADATPLGHGALDAALETIGGSAKPRTVQDWVGRLPKAIDLRQRLLDDLVARGVLERRAEKILFIFPTTRYPERDGAAEDAIRARIDASLRGETEPDTRTRVLARLIKSCNLINPLYERSERKAIGRRIEALAADDSYTQTIERAVADTQAAINAAIIASTVAATTAASSAACASATSAACN